MQFKINKDTDLKEVAEGIAKEIQKTVLKGLGDVLNQNKGRENVDVTLDILVNVYDSDHKPTHN